mgnify:CR=1 FL=1
MMLISCRVEHHNLIYVFMEIFILMMILFGIVVSYYSDFLYNNVKTLSLRSTQSLQWANSIKIPLMFT